MVAGPVYEQVVTETVKRAKAEFERGDWHEAYPTAKLIGKLLGFLIGCFVKGFLLAAGAITALKLLT